MDDFGNGYDALPHATDVYAMIRFFFGESEVFDEQCLAFYGLV